MIMMIKVMTKAMTMTATKKNSDYKGYCNGNEYNNINDDNADSMTSLFQFIVKLFV